MLANLRRLGWGRLGTARRPHARRSMSKRCPQSRPAIVSIFSKSRPTRSLGYFASVVRGIVVTFLFFTIRSPLSLLPPKVWPRTMSTPSPFLRV